MSQSKLSKWLKWIIYGAGFCGGIICFYIIPDWGKDIVTANPEFSYYYLPWLLFLWIAAVPCIGILICAWKIANAVGKDNTISMKNVKYLKTISLLSAGDSIYIFVGNLLFLLLNMNHPGIVLLSFFIEFIGIAVAVLSASISHLVYKEVKIHEENELII